MKKPLTTIATVAALGLAFSAQAGALFDGSTDFESIGMDDPYFAGNTADSSIETDASVEAVASRPANYEYAATRDKVLCVESTNAVFRTLKDQGAAANLADGSVYADMLVKGAAVNVGQQVNVSSPDDKILLYFKKTADGSTTNLNLCALAGWYDDTVGDNGEFVSDGMEYTLSTPASLGALSENAWYRLVLVATNEVNIGGGRPGFQVYLGGCGPDYLCTVSADDKYLPNSVVLPSLLATATISSFGFAGSGYVDDFVVSTIDPNKVAVTLTWPTNLTSVSYAVGGGTPTNLTAAAGSATIEIDPGETVTLSGGFGNYVKKVSGSSGTLALPASEINYFFPRTTTLGQDGTAEHPYEIADIDDLYALRDAVADHPASRSLCYVQTADIDMYGEAEFAGIGSYNETSPMAGVSFSGTYDGQNYKISNVTMAARNYGGIFNQVGGGTIKNLTVEDIYFLSGGFAIVGNFGGDGAVLQNLTAAGSFGDAGMPGTHNMAGIVVRACGGGETGALVKDCTNNAAIYGNYTKLAGICTLTQRKLTGAGITFDGCVNNGSLNLSRTSTGVTGFAGIVAYESEPTVLVGCSNTGSINNTASGANTDCNGQLVGYAYNQSLTDNGGNSAPSNAKMIGKYGTSAVTGFKYATVDNGVATTVTTLAANETYLLEGNVPASETPVATLTAVGDWIAFDTALGYTFAGTVGNSGAAGIPVATTVGTVTTYTAGYFPRTATAGQNGSAANPFEIADLDDLEALQAAVANDAATYAGLCYVQTADIALTNAWEGIGVKAGKDLVNGSGKNIPAYEAGAFCGTYDGGNFTISNFQMENGTDYGALFNSINNATVKNLKVSYKEDKLCANSSSSGGDTGATFVGVARGSTLQNLTALAGTVTTVSASKDIGGIVGYLMGGSTVESCTNELNVASLKTGRKCGGIAIITQDGSGSAIIRNCKNSGTVTAASAGAIVGYVGVATTIDACENTAAVQLVHFQSGSVTASGVNKGNATVASNDKSGGVANLYFATVDGSVATFVADNALAAGNTYKVMSAGATATYAFAEAGTIAFDTALYTPTYAITAAEGLTLTDETVGTVTTYTASAPQAAYPDYLEYADSTIKGLYDTWADANGADTGSAYEKQFLLDVSPRVEIPTNALHIASITSNATNGWDIVVECAVENVPLSGTVGTARVCNGYLAVSTAADLDGPWTIENLPVTAAENGTVTVNVTPVGDAAFLKVLLAVGLEADN